MHNCAMSNHDPQSHTCPHSMSSEHDGPGHARAATATPESPLTPSPTSFRFIFFPGNLLRSFTYHLVVPPPLHRSPRDGQTRQSLEQSRVAEGQRDPLFGFYCNRRGACVVLRELFCVRPIQRTRGGEEGAHDSVGAGGCRGVGGTRCLILGGTRC